jgi:hypothetical protein
MRISAQGTYDSLEATLVNACFKSGGRSFPRFSARRRIPAQAFWLKKNLGGMLPVSKTRDNEDSTASLGNSEMLRIQDTVRPPVAEFAQRPKEGTKVPSSVATEDSWDVFPEERRDPEVLGDGKVGEHEASARIFESFAESGDGERLAGRASHKNVN